MIVFAHRGASGYSPQNSLASIKKALELGAKAIEFDVQLSKDRVPVVIHDFFLDNLTTNGKGYVKNYTLKELKKFKLKNRFQEDYSEETIPTLEEFMSQLPNDMLINVEMKALLSDKKGLEDSVVEILKKFPEKKNIIISSFDHELLKEIQNKYPEYKLGILTDTNILNMDQYFINSEIKASSINLGLDLAEKSLVEKLHSHGFKVFVYTVNCKKIAAEMLSIGVDGIFSDYVDILNN
ncbi:MAG: glycerophosphodiester phosphodiesterase [Fusobacteriaceae bacterium]